MTAVSDRALAILRRNGIRFAPGLSEDEFAWIRDETRLEFSRDHRDLLAQAVPLGEFEDWRSDPGARVRDAWEWVVTGILFDVEHNVFWPSDWGSRASGASEREATVRARLAEVPPLIPLWHHRFVPAGHLGTVPVFSVSQTDVIYYGMDLAQWAVCEFEGGPNYTDSDDRVIIPFWDAVANGYGDRFETSDPAE